MSLLKNKQLNKNEGYYFPLFNYKGLRASVSPFFDGDLKLSHHQYALLPISETDLFTHTYSRNVVFNIDGSNYFLNGQTEHQQKDEVIYSTGLLFQKVLRKNNLFNLETISYVAMDANLELHQITLTNRSNKAIICNIHTAIPLYSRSADHLRDHRHVTSLLNEVYVDNRIISVKPTLTFDERGHQINQTRYSLGVYSDSLTVNRYIPVLDDYINGGSITFPKGLCHHYPVGSVIQGYEAMGAIGFDTYELLENHSLSFVVMIGIHENDSDFKKDYLKYQSSQQFDRGLKDVQSHFNDYVKGLSFSFSNQETSDQLSWVMLQPLLRRYYGNSFLPHHDYGRGGKGWRDLWQDLLSLILNNDPSVQSQLLNHFAGVRIDGSNATIIGDKPGEFKADRNMITRVWSDHGAWPLLTTKMYIDETGDLAFLLSKQVYFQDQFTHYTKKNQEGSQRHHHKGTILEHLLIQNLVGFHNIGNHGYLKLEDADWNDGLDMANKRGESVAFTHFYASNILKLSEMIQQLKLKTIELIEPLKLLMKPHADLSVYFNQVAKNDFKTVHFDTKVICEQLDAIAKQKIEFLQKEAFDGQRFLSYYDNKGESIDHDQSANLTGQAIALLSNVPLLDQAKKVFEHTRKHLFEPSLGGYRLNTNYHKVMLDMGRAFGFAYGHKENGAVFSHMVMMYAYGLYHYGLVKEGHEAFITLIKRSMDQESHVWAGIPEYFNDRGIGKYSYLTGSASWLLKLIRDQVFGIQMAYGQLTLNPKLTKNDFINHKASITTYLFNQLTTITYHNPKSLNYGEYQIKSILAEGAILSLPICKPMTYIEVYLDEIL